MKNLSRTTFRVITAVMFLSVLPSTGRAALDLPANGPVTSGVGWRVDPFGSGRLVFHKGIDIAVPEGTPVRATRGGRVAHAGIHGGHGFTVIVEHDDGGKTLYGHNSALKVRPGERLEAGAVVALSGNTGRSTGPHVHYEVWPAEKSMVAEKHEGGVEPTPAPDGGLRHRQEQRLDEIVNSILRGLGRSSVAGAGKGQGG
ncbi:M23 family metallopeptidase [Geobacter sp.]|uniref:M23 family metallopeptidase n=1 Tax=Geobacter sp. TaxID=46610 RepID=UPI0035A00209